MPGVALFELETGGGESRGGGEEGKGGGEAGPGNLFQIDFQNLSCNSFIDIRTRNKQETCAAPPSSFC